MSAEMLGVNVYDEAVREAIAAEVSAAVLKAEGNQAIVPELLWGREGYRDFVYFGEPVFEPGETRRLVAALHETMTPRLPDLTPSQTIWHWGAGRLLAESGEADEKLRLIRPKGKLNSQVVEVGFVELPVNAGSNQWRGLNLKFSCLPAVTDFVKDDTIIAWPYGSQRHAARKGNRPGLINSVHFGELPEDIESNFLDWLIKDMNDAESTDKITERKSAAIAELNSDGRSIEEIFKQTFPGEDFTGETWGRLEVVGQRAYAAWLLDHPAAR